MNENTFLGRFVEEALLAIRPLHRALQNSGDFDALMRDLGWNVSSASNAYTAINSAVNAIFNDYAALPANPSESDILTIIADFSSLYTAITNVTNAPAPLSGPAASAFLSSLPGDLGEYLIVSYLAERQPAALSLLRLLGIIKYITVPASGYKASYSKLQLDWTAFGQVFSNPSAALNTALGWATSTFVTERLFELLLELFSGWDKTAYIYKLNAATQAVYERAFANTDIRKNGVYLNFFSVKVGANYIPFGIHIIESLGTSVPNFGVILRLDFPQGIALVQDINDSLKLKLGVSFASSESLLISLKPSGITTKLLNGSIASLQNSKVDFGITYAPPEPKFLFGRKNGSNLQLEKIELNGSVRLGDDPEVVLEIGMDGLKFILNKNDFDGFIRKILGSGDTSELNIPLALRWSSKTGLTLKGSGSFEVELPQTIKLGAVELSSIKVSLRKSDSTNSVVAALSSDIHTTVGPLILTVSGMGVGMSILLSGGNMGIFGIKAGIKPPTGVGISIDSPAVTGGGFLAYDEAAATYTGALELTISKVSLKAIGILTTKLPGGQSGYSLLILITAEFTPIQLGLGFTLNGVGGLLALNRTVDEAALKGGIYNNTLGNILFPQNIVQNAGAIISSLNSVFPIKEGRFLVGPMAKIGWGTPTLLTIDLGIFIEMPAPVRLLLLGVLKASLPDEKNPILKLQVNFIGIIDFDKKKLSFDATLYNSKILTFALAGDMAVRLFWGDRPRFLITAGGFHPKFEPPPMELPNLRRLSISLVNTDNLRINAEAYYAITSNSAQFGASVNLWAKAWKATAEGKVWMDVLFKFSPFYFSADMGAHFAIKWNGKNKFSAQLTLKVEGPNPWRVQGEASFEICWIDVTIRFNKTFGQASTEVVAAVSLWPKVEAAVNHKDNWIVEGPERIQPMVSYREVPVTDTELLIDPFGGLRFSQKVVPLNVTLQKSGSAAISDYVRFSIGQITSTPTPGTTITLPTVSTRDYFARNEFFFMTEDEKLSRESYELNESGVRIGNTDELFSDFFTLRVISYEETFIDLRYRYWRFGGLFLTPERMRLHTYGDYISRSDISNFRDVTPLGGPAKVNLSAAENTFVLANRNSLTAVSSDTYLNFQQAEEELALLQSSNPAAAADYIIVNAFEL